LFEFSFLDDFKKAGGKLRTLTHYGEKMLAGNGQTSRAIGPASNVFSQGRSNSRDLITHHPGQPHTDIIRRHQ
jgi:hypothetical protein